MKSIKKTIATYSFIAFIGMSFLASSSWSRVQIPCHPNQDCFKAEKKVKSSNNISSTTTAKKKRTRKKR